MKIFSQILIVTLFFLQGCSLFFSTAFKQPEIGEIKEVKIESISPFGCTVNVKTEIISKNPVSGYLTNASYKLFVNDEYFASGSSSKRQYIEKNSTSLIQLPVSVRSSDLVPATLNLFSKIIKGESLKYRVEGTVTAEIEGFSFDLPLNIEKNYKN